MIEKNLQDLGGLPSKQILNPNKKYDSSGPSENEKENYFLQDEEFYPLLFTSISLFEFKFGKLPQFEKNLAAKHWMGEKAVKEFFKAINSSNKNLFIK